MFWGLVALITWNVPSSSHDYQGVAVFRSDQFLESIRQFMLKEKRDRKRDVSSRGS